MTESDAAIVRPPFTGAIRTAVTQCIAAGAEPGVARCLSENGPYDSAHVPSIAIRTCFLNQIPRQKESQNPNEHVFARTWRIADLRISLSLATRWNWIT